MIVFNTILAKAVLQPLSEREDLALCFSKRVTVFTTVLLAFFCEEKSVASGKNALVSCASLEPLAPERELPVCGQLRGSLGNHLHS